MKIDADRITLAYRLFLGRPPSPDEVALVTAEGHDLEGLRQMFLASREFSRVYADFQEHGGLPLLPGGARTLVHLHIPKTAGTSLNALLFQRYPPTVRLPNLPGSAEAVLAEMDAGDRASVRLIARHCVYGIHRLLPHPVHYLCVLRRPVDRVYSFYRFVRRTEVHPHHDLLTRRRADFGTFLEIAEATPPLRAEIDNGQMRRLAGQMAGPPAAQTMYETAIAHLERENMSFGLTEDFGAFLKRLAAARILRAAPAPRINAAPEGETALEQALAGLTRPQRALLDRFTAWDSQLYDFARARLEADPAPAEPAG